ncbi:MAG: TonB-dependent receptor, partial [Luteimonas sp.]|nr:TonB-dependent receptor [Luteimonas sp.]
QNNNWRIRSNLLARWELGDWGATWASRFYSKQDEDCGTMVYYGWGELCSDEANEENRIGGTTYHDASVYWNSPWNAKVTIGVNNILDKDPPVSYSTFANSFDPQYEVPGRFLYLQYNQKF